MPAPGSNRVYPPSIQFSTFMLMKHDDAKCLKDVRHLHRESGLMKLLGFENVPDAKTLGNWLRRIGDSSQSRQALVGSTSKRPNSTAKVHEAIRR